MWFWLACRWVFFAWLVAACRERARSGAGEPLVEELACSLGLCLLAMLLAGLLLVGVVIWIGVGIADLTGRRSRA